jgi:predicted Zn-dependent peptidase
MSLVVLGGQPVQQLEAWVREAFEAVPQGIAGPPASFESAGKPFQVTP